eukprot:6213609-Pleurochrysis_carterae.AAC.4
MDSGMLQVAMGGTGTSKDWWGRSGFDWWGSGRVGGVVDACFGSNSGCGGQRQQLENGPGRSIVGAQGMMETRG